ncbi:hypothetical protein NMY22_g8313 [Coprinellus aureogranulatus]|nr:hypothetical protein NMY22_g8313 [Coprinellus aureogranulatus]
MTALSLSSRLSLKHLSHHTLKFFSRTSAFSNTPVLANKKTRIPAISKMVKVTLNGTTLAESTDTIVVEGNHYFPPASIKKEYFKDSDTHTICPWKGYAQYHPRRGFGFSLLIIPTLIMNSQASYYTLSLPDAPAVPDAAWYYPECKEKAKNIEGYVAFYKNKVEITE